MVLGEVLPILMLEAVGGVVIAPRFGECFLRFGLAFLLSKEGLEEGHAGGWGSGAAEVSLGLLESGGAGDFLVAVIVIDAGEEGGGSIVYAPEGADYASGSGAEVAGAKGQEFVGEVSLVAEVGFAARHEDFIEIWEAPARGDELTDGDAAIPKEQGGF